jgi:hypothetical protein
MFRNFITLAAVAGLVAGASAQQQVPAGNVLPVSNLQYGSYDFDNGFTVTSGSTRAMGPDTLFDTTPDPAYYFAGTGVDSQEWLDSAQLPNRGLSGEEQINGFAWSYCEASGIAYFDSNINIYNDTVSCAGPSVWVPGVASFPDCVYGLSGVPGLGCWTISVDLSCGFECTVPDASNPLSGAEGTIGWSVVTRSGVNAFVGPLLTTQAHATPGSSDLFEWRDNNGAFWGAGAYYQAGCYWFGGSAYQRADFPVGFYGAAIDVQNCYGSNPLDTLCLEALDAAESGGTWNYQVTGFSGPDGQRAYLLASADPLGLDTCDQATVNGNWGSFTRQINPANMLSAAPIFLGRQDSGWVRGGYTGSVVIPARAGDMHVFFQVVSLAATGNTTPLNVTQSSNGIDTTL